MMLTATALAAALFWLIVWLWFAPRTGGTGVLNLLLPALIVVVALTALVELL